LVPKLSPTPLRQRSVPVPHASKRTIVLAVIAGVVITAGSVVLWRALNRGDGLDGATEQRLRRAAAAARVYAEEHGDYRGVTVMHVADRARDLPVVPADKVARAGEVSFRMVDADRVVLATRGADGSCAFARDDLAQHLVEFSTARAPRCAAAAAPRTGWHAIR
jgi:hypothetical protein